MSLYSDNLIKQSVSDFIGTKAAYRRRYVQKLIDYYTGTNAAGYISGFFSAGSFQEIPRYHMNITRKFIDKMSRIYTAPPERKLKNKTMSNNYANLTRYKDTRLNHVEKMTNLIGSIATYVYFDEKPDYWVVSNGEFTIEMSMTGHPLWQARKHVDDAFNVFDVPLFFNCA